MYILKFDITGHETLNTSVSKNLEFKSYSKQYGVELQDLYIQDLQLYNIEM